MTNIELCREIQAGHEELIPDLWRQNQKFIRMMSQKYFKAYYSNCGCELEDLIQSGYEAVYRAVKTFDCDSGFSFLTWLEKYLHTSFSEAAGVRSESDKAQRRWESKNISLDAPLSSDDENDTTIQDIIPDVDAEEAFCRIENDIFLEGAKPLLDDLIDTLSPKYAGFVREMYYDNKSIKQIAEENNISYQSVRHTAFDLRYKLRHTPEGQRLRQYYQMSRDGDYNYSASGLQSFTRTGMSETERAAFRLLRAEQSQQSSHDD